jgi:hypothetical protein
MPLLDLSDDELAALTAAAPSGVEDPLPLLAPAMAKLDTRSA